jgi:hypothetical protein
VFFFPSLLLFPRAPLLSPSRFGFARRVKQDNNQHSRPEEKDQTDRIGLCPDKSDEAQIGEQAQKEQDALSASIDF